MSWTCIPAQAGELNAIFESNRAQQACSLQEEPVILSLPPRSFREVRTWLEALDVHPPAAWIEEARYLDDDVDLMAILLFLGADLRVVKALAAKKEPR